MSDFAQNGRICTLQRLLDPNLQVMEAELASISKQRPLALVLPCHSSDLAQPALRRILQEVASAPYISEVVISVNGPLTTGAGELHQQFEKVPQPFRILVSDTSEISSAVTAACGMEPARGKGFNVWLACGLLIGEGAVRTIVTQDCDVLSFDRENFARLCFAAMHPELAYPLAKMYYSRVTDRFYGRVSRLFLAPLLQALVRVAGHHPLIDFLQSFRYPLAGETALSCEVAADLPMSPGWGLDLGLLCEAFRRMDPRQIAQVDGGSGYEHRHHPLGDEGGGLARMSLEIAMVLLPQLAAEGLPLEHAFLTALQSSFAVEATEAVRRYRHLGLINGLVPNASDLDGATLFCASLRMACEEFNSGISRPGLPGWQELLAAKPREAQALLRACAPA